MIEMQPNARYVILGEDRAHASLTELVRYHQTVGIQPFMEILTVPCGQVSGEDLQQEEGHGLHTELGKSLQQCLCSGVLLEISNFSQAPWPLLHAPANVSSWVLRSPGVSEAVPGGWMIPPASCWSQLFTDEFSLELCCLGCVEHLQATAESTLLSLRKAVRVWIMKTWSASR